MKEEDKRKRGFHGNGNQHMYLLVIAMAGVFFATLSSAQEVEYSSVSFISSEDVYLLPCVYRGVPYSHGESWAVDDCSTCTCANSTIECVILGCQPTTCDNVIHPPGECCAMCPNIVNVSEVAPVARVTSTPKLMSGKKNRMLLNVSISFHETDLTTGVQGEDLWNMTIWTSRNPNGEGFAYSVAKNVLNAEQRSQRHRKGKKFPKLRNIPYTLDARRMSCDDMQYICVRFEQAINPGHVNRAYVPFYFSGYPDDNVLTGCTPAPRCKIVKPKSVPTTARPATTLRTTTTPTTIPTTWPRWTTAWPRWTRAPTLPPTRPPTLPPTFPPTLPPRRTTRRPKLKKTKEPKSTPATLPPTLAPLTTLKLNEALAVGSTMYATLPPTLRPTVRPTTGVPYIPRFVLDDSESNEAFELVPMYPLAQRNSNRPRSRNRGRNKWRAHRFKAAAEAAGFSSDEVTQIKQKKISRRRQQAAKRKPEQPLPLTQEQQEYRQQQQQLYQQQQQQYNQQMQYEQQQQQLQYEQQRQQQYQEQQQQYYQQQHQENNPYPYGDVQEGQINPLFQREREKAIAEGTLLGPQQGWPAAYNNGYTWQQYMEDNADYNSQER
ncbi:uncharacterized protein LOC121411242 isoform X2 [Lytechinus variegatus]|uniref:uncharacterized protein LOC121411242 isoform X2 n=1 Tax=Lytechinus variegatus TaxID=7654 RepID=UPI001BB15B80|nr:uncharacterized protein LOC121411242 isoform X2 [Lytechinus variegatus]